ncbi:mucin-4-like isoform X2 [Melanerpes formicivorus]|uniref:mucin-4-like isoform X2 n=1 Tax=Melanerpes formicivorus TaxID=211600 RepID=UPI00358E8FB3
MGTRGWTLSTFMGCCIWILHGLGAAAVPVTTEGPFDEGTASSVTAESEWPAALVMGTVETITAAADAETAESILAGSLSSPSPSPGAELNALVTVTSKHGTTAPTLTNVTKPLNTSQDIERDSAAPAAAMTTPAVSTQHLTVIPDADLDIIGATPSSPLGTTPFFADVKEDVLTAVTREGAEDQDLTTSTMSFPTTLPLTPAWVAQPTAGSPVDAGVTVLPSQELTTAIGAVEEGVALPVVIHSDASANSFNPSPGAGGLLTTQQDRVVSSATSLTPEPTGESGLAAEESPLASVSENVGSAVNDEFSTASSTHLPLESPTVSETVGNPGEHSLLPGQVALSPAASLVPSSSGDVNGQDAPGVSSEPPASALSPAASKAPTAPEATEDMATSLLAPEAPTEAQSGTSPLVPVTALPRGDMGSVGLAQPSLQPSSWQIPAGEQQLLPSPTDTPSAPEAIYPPSGAGADILPAVDGTETPASPDLGAAPGAAVSPSLEGSQPWATAADASQGVIVPDTDLSSPSDASTPSSFVPEGLAWPIAGVQGQGPEGAGDTAQAEGPGNGNLYADTQSDTSPSATGAQQDPAYTGELPAGGTGPLVNAELSPPSAPGDVAGATSGLGQVSPPGLAPPSASGLEPGLSGAEGPGNLPGESVSAPGSAYLPSGAVSGPETPASPDLGAAPGAAVSPSLEGSQLWGTAADASQGVIVRDTDLSSPSDASTPSSFVPEGLAWPIAGVQGQGPEGAGDTAQAEGPGNGNLYADTQSDTSPSATGAQQDPAYTGELPAGGTRPLVNAELSPPSAPGDVAGATSGLGQVSPPGLVPPSASGLEPGLSGAEGPGNLPGESASAPGSAYPPSGAVSGPETPASPDLGAAPGAAVSPSLEGSQPWATAADASQGVIVPDTDLSSPSDASTPSSFVPEGLAWPIAGVQGQGPEGAGDTAQAEGPGNGNLYADTQSDTSPSATGAQQDPANTGELPAGGTRPLVNAELSLPSAPGDVAGATSGLGQVSPPGLAPPSAPGLEPGLSGAEGPGNLPGESVSAPGSAYPPSGAVSGPETPASPDLGAASGASVPPTPGGSQLWETAADALQGAGLPGANGPGSGSAAYGSAGVPSSTLEDQLGASLGLPAAEGHGDSTTEQALGGAGSGIRFEPSLSSTAGSGIAPGTDQLPGTGSSSGPASPSSVVASPSLLNPDSSSTPTGVGSASGALQPSLGAGPGVPPAAGEGAGEVRGDAGSLGQSQATAGQGVDVSGALDGERGVVLKSGSSSTSTEGSSTSGTVGDTINGASIPGASGAGSGLSTSLEAAGPEQSLVSAPGIQSGANLGLSDAKPSQDNVVELPGGASADGGPSPEASLGETAGAAIQTSSGTNVNVPPQERQPLVPVAPDGSSVSDSTASSLPTSLLPGRGLSSGLESNGNPYSSPSIQSGSRSLVPGAPGGLAGDAGGAQTWSLEDEVASGMPTHSGDTFPYIPMSPSTAPVLPSAPQRDTAAAGTSASPGLPAPLLAPAAVPLYGYGARENDREYVERRVDFNSPLFKPETGFPFGKTLRDSLYFTDNGQIIFPASDNNILTNPNPPPNGFNGHEEVPMIAVFWDNADFSRGVGTTFYQEFLTLNTVKPPFVRDVEEKVRRYLRSSYSAAWTLKITWEKAPAHAARTDTRRTITYQAVLTTDGFRSYILMLYQDGGMQWDYTKLAATNVLIGYTSGDGFYRNDDLSKRPPAVKYRPDQFRGYNTDLRGLWIYKLESRVGVNYRLKCLAWTGRQQEPQMWSQGLPACPCSLQQGQQDPRFKSSRRGWWGARLSMLHSAAPNQHGASVRCLYDSQGQLIEGRQERYWRSSRQASPYRDQELKLYDWCCNQAGSAHLCARYSEKRPKIGCDGYQSPGKGSSEEAESDSEERRDEEDK